MTEPNPTASHDADFDQSGGPLLSDGRSVVPDVLPEFLVVHSTETDESGRQRPLKLNPFQRVQALSKYGNPKQVTLRADGSLELQMTDDDAIRKMLTAKELSYHVRGKGLCRVAVKVVAHPTKNNVRGVISCPDLRGVTEEEVVEGMAGEGVTEARRIRRRERGTLVDTDAIILTMKRPSLPDEVKVGYLSVPIKLYVPDPIRCFKCQAFGHVSQKCRGDLRCGSCSTKGHEAKDCTSESLKCSNCGGAHKAWDKKCSKYVHEREIRAVMVQERIPFRDAQAKVRARTPAPVLLYRDVAARKSTPTQPKKSGTELRSTSDLDAVFQGLHDLRRMSVADLIEVLNRISAGTESIAPPPASEAFPQAAEPTNPEGEQDGWETAGRKGRSAGRRSPPPTASRAPMQTDGHASPSSPLGGCQTKRAPAKETAVAAALRRNQELAREREERRASILAKAKESLLSTGAGSPASPSEDTRGPALPKEAPVTSSSKPAPVGSTGSTSQMAPRPAEMASPAEGTILMGPPSYPPPPPPRLRAPSPPSAPAARTSGRADHPSQTPPSSPSHAGLPPTPGRPGKRTLPWADSAMEGSPRSRVRSLDSREGRSSSADGRLSRGRGVHPRVHFGPPPRTETSEDQSF